MVEATIQTLVTTMTASVYQIARAVPVVMMAAVEPAAPVIATKSAHKEIA